MVVICNLCDFIKRLTSVWVSSGIPANDVSHNPSSYHFVSHDAVAYYFISRDSVANRKSKRLSI